MLPTSVKGADLSGLINSSLMIIIMFFILTLCLKHLKIIQPPLDPTTLTWRNIILWKGVITLTVLERLVGHGLCI